MQDQELRFKKVQINRIGILGKTSHRKQPEASTYYSEKAKQHQITKLKFHKASICEEDQHVKPFPKPWTYQVPQLE